MALPTNRTTANTPAEHVADHNTLHGFYNAWETFTPAQFAPLAHGHNASDLSAGTLPASRIAGTLTAGFVCTLVAGVPTWQAGGGGGGSGITDTRYIFLDTYSGTDDEKLDDAHADALTVFNAGEPVPSIVLMARNHSFNTKGRTLFEGFSMIAPGSEAFQEAAGSQSGRKATIDLNFSSSSDGIGWFHATSTAQCRNIHFENLAIVSGNRASFLTQSSDAVNWWMLSLHNISTSGLWCVLGHKTGYNTGQRFVMTGCHFTGTGWNVNNGGESAFYLCGSDNVLFSDGGLLDSNVANHPASGAGRYHLHLSFLTKTYIGPLFITAEEKWGACFVEGSNYNQSVTDNSGGPIRFFGTIFEGRNPTEASFGSVFRQDGGITIHFGCDFRQAMEAPATAGRSPVDAGAIHVFGGAKITLYCPSYDRAAGQAETVPFISANGVDTIVRPHDVQFTTRGGTWTGLPRVAAGTAQILGSDGTYTVI
jgi:hypothetical protein